MNRIVFFLLAATVAAAGCTVRPEQHAKAVVLKRFPIATITTTSLAPAESDAVCGEVEADGAPPRLFAVKNESTRLRLSGDADLDLAGFLRECRIAHGSREAAQATRRWNELAELWDQRRADAARRERGQRTRERIKQWVDDNEDGLRALNEAADRLQ
ncbi:hypothetical protein [uncultured Massilia sp.]|uniref:hypothetical protein n=1 Tax=uncultured Massilia sp. TaxID=169973 RepID=UPI0025E4C71E|nr:hypothetical protein [uncultured Massilia sp.]